VPDGAETESNASVCYADAGFFVLSMEIIEFPDTFPLKSKIPAPSLFA